MRRAGEIRADLAHCDRNNVPWPSAALRLLSDIPQLLDGFDRLVAQNAELANTLSDTAAERDSLREVVRAVEAVRNEMRDVHYSGTVRGYYVARRLDSGLAAAADAPQPTRCDHGKAEAHSYIFASVPRESRWCPGPSPAVLPEDGCAECTEAGTKNCTAGCRDTPR